MRLKETRSLKERVRDLEEEQNKLQDQRWRDQDWTRMREIQKENEDLKTQLKELKEKKNGKN